MIHASAKKPKVLVVMGSIRAGRLCPAIASWVVSVAPAGLDCETIDLLDWHLPMTDEPVIPALGQYAQAHTRAWSDKVGSADAIMFVTPQYNWGYPAPLKNALDHLHKEWSGKPAIIVTYGGHGGNKCAAQLRQVTEALHMRPVPTMPGLILSRDAMASGRVVPETEFAAHADEVRRAMAQLVEVLEK